MDKVFVVVPAFNEEKTIKQCIERIQKYHTDIIVVDDGSKDGTVAIVKELTGSRNPLRRVEDEASKFGMTVELISLKKNKGKGFTMREGAEYAWKHGAGAVLFMDADNQHDPKHISSFLELLNKKTDIILGIRVLRAHIPFYRKLGSDLISFLMRHLFGIDLPDMICGFRAFTKKGYEQIKWKSNGYGVELETLARIGKMKLPYKTVVVDTIYHDKYKGFSILDGIKLLFQIPRWRFVEL